MKELLARRGFSFSLISPICEREEEGLEEKKEGREWKTYLLDDEGGQGVNDFPKGRAVFEVVAPAADDDVAQTKRPGLLNLWAKLALNHLFEEGRFGCDGLEWYFIFGHLPEEDAEAVDIDLFIVGLTLCNLWGHISRKKRRGRERLGKKGKRG